MNVKMMTKLEILDLYTFDRDISLKLISDYEKNISLVSDRENFKLEEVLKITPYIEKLENEHIFFIETIFKNNFPNDLVVYITYLFFRAKLGKFMTLNLLTQPVVDNINTLFIDFFPNKLPDLLKSGIYIQSKNGVLFDDIERIIINNEKPGLYQPENNRFSLILWKKDNSYIYSSMVYSTILGRFVEDLNKLDFEGKTSSGDIEPFKKALIFSFVFAIFIKSDNSPTTVKDSNKSENAKKDKTIIERKNVEGWIERTIYINKKYLSKKNDLQQGILYKDDKILKQVRVSGHLRRLPNKENEYTYIPSFISSRWVLEGDKKITYYLK
jgi:hypothetical protein